MGSEFLTDTRERWVEVDGKMRRVPSPGRLQHWMLDSVAKATDGCNVEPDGHCPHGKASWLVVLGLI